MSKTIFVIGAAITDVMGFPFGKPQPADSVPGLMAKAPGGVMESRRRWSYEVETRPRRTDPAGVVVKLRGLQSV